MPSSGRPSILAKRSISRMLRVVNKYPFISSKQLSEEMPIAEDKFISPRAIMRYLQNAGLQSYRARRKPLLTPAQKT